MDFKLTPQGDIRLSASRDVEAITSLDEWLRQYANVSVQTIEGDWYMDSVGASLEQLIGMPTTSSAVALGKSLLTDALTRHGRYTESDIYIEDEVNGREVTFRLYLKESSGLAHAVQIRIGEHVVIL